MLCTSLVLRCRCVLLVVVYSLECLVRFCAHPAHYCKVPWKWFDILLILPIASQLFIDDCGVPFAGLLRVFRLVKILRLLNILRRLPTLWNLLCGLLGAILAIVLGLVLIVLLLAVWSLIGVELTCTLEVVDSDDVEPVACRDAMSTVVQARLYLFTTLVADGGWGICAVPIIEPRGSKCTM